MKIAGKKYSDLKVTTMSMSQLLPHQEQIEMISNTKLKDYLESQSISIQQIYYDLIRKTTERYKRSKRYGEILTMYLKQLEHVKYQIYPSISELLRQSFIWFFEIMAKKEIKKVENIIGIPLINPNIHVIKERPPPWIYEKPIELIPLIPYELTVNIIVSHLKERGTLGRIELMELCNVDQGIFDIAIKKIMKLDSIINKHKNSQRRVTFSVNEENLEKYVRERNERTRDRIKNKGI